MVVVDEYSICTFSSPSFASEGAGESATFNMTVVQDRDSLILQGIEREGTDILASLHEIWNVAIGGFLTVGPSRAHIFPIDIHDGGLVSMPDRTEKRVNASIGVSSGSLP